MPEFVLDSALTARSLTSEHAPALLACILANRAHLDRWLRWSSSIQTLDDATDFIDRFAKQEAEGNGFHLGLFLDGRLVGGSICWGISPEDRSSEVGYWLDSKHTGNGYATLVSKAVLGHLFRNSEVERVEMQCGEENLASRAVAERCGLTLDETRRTTHWITDRTVEHVVYGIGVEEWAEAE